MASGSFDLAHNNDGTRWLDVSGGINPYANARSEGSGSWQLPTIPRQVNISNVTGNYTSDQLNPTVTWSPNGNRTDLKIEMPSLGINPWKRWNNLGGSSYAPVLDATDRAYLCSLIPNANSINLRFTIVTFLNGADTFFSYIDRTFTIVDANPIFADTHWSYDEANQDVLAITGNSKVLVQGKSTLNVDLFEQMEARKGAFRAQYTGSFGTTNVAANDQDWVPKLGLSMNLGTPMVAGEQRLTVKAFDSRNNNTSTFRDIMVIPYADPVVNALVERAGGFETQTTLKIAGTFSLVEVSGVAKNAVNTSTGVKYRHKQSSSSSWGAWTSVTANIDGAGVSVADIFMNCDNNSQWDFEVSITDKFGTTVTSMTLPVGKPIMHISKNRKVGINKIAEDGALDISGLLNIGNEDFKKYRYIRVWQNGSTANAGNHVVQVKACELGGTTNLALNKPVTSNGANNPERPLSRITNNNLDTGDYANLQEPGLMYAEIDLQGEYYIDEVRVWRYFADNRTYNGTKTELITADRTVTRIIGTTSTYQEHSCGQIFRNDEYDDVIATKGNLKINGRLIKAPREEDWNMPPLESGWQTYGDGVEYGTARYKKVDGVVYMKGLLRSGTIANNSTGAGRIFLLPPGYRPKQRLMFAVFSDGGGSRLDILSNGSVLAVTGQNGYYTIACSFLAEQ